ncbi:muskelin-like [Dendronephthya gigantea]|uniref:muskelin-like n=1 Tax=Dendronephthya gigantea TaxID=151771 RepID=UPI00106D618A|nr:muskelin-like [Dendronephthya gigantea]
MEVEHLEQKLKYSVHSCSSFSANFHPDNILEDKPNDQNSRWTSETHHPTQYITLKLEKPAAVTKITFGKYYQNHVCNLKKFKVFGSLHDDHENMIELLASGLKNDSVKETFPLRHKLGENIFPVKYIKIVPTMTWGQSFNCSIWFVQLTGVNDPVIVKSCSNWINNYREREAIRLCLKHLRQRNCTEAFDSLKKKTKVDLEHPILTDLHEQLVVNSNFDMSEKIIEKAAHDGLFSDYINTQDYKAKWSPITTAVMDTNSEACQPGMRGGHQMCIDTDRQIIYLLGGWDGNDDLADFWMFDIKGKSWRMISRDTEQDGGPCARSCHKICLDHKRKLIFMLGRYLDSEVRNTISLKSDFFLYNIEGGHWTLISEDTTAEGGPPLIFDHQMCVNVENGMIFVFGGRVLLSTSSDIAGLASSAIFSGLFCYHSGTNTWTKLRDDCPELISRIGHSMLFYEKNQALYIFAGQRGREFLNNFTMYNTETDTVTVLSNNKDEVPAAGFTQRATIDPETGEIHALSGLSKDKIKREESTRNSFWVYDIENNKWSCIYRNENTGNQYWSKMQSIEPCPRFAHQLVYDHINKVHYLFGGNPGKSGFPKMRLDDFWLLRLTKPSLPHFLRRCRFLIRRQKFVELAKCNSLEALAYLQHDLSALVNTDDIDERHEFERLTSSLFTLKEEMNEACSSNEGAELFSDDQAFIGRSQLFDQLVTYFPDNMTQPKGNLTDIIKI